MVDPPELFNDSLHFPTWFRGLANINELQCMLMETGFLSRCWQDASFFSSPAEIAVPKTWGYCSAPSTDLKIAACRFVQLLFLSVQAAPQHTCTLVWMPCALLKCWWALYCQESDTNWTEVSDYLLLFPLVAEWQFISERSLITMDCLKVQYIKTQR